MYNFSAPTTYALYISQFNVNDNNSIIAEANT